MGEAERLSLESTIRIQSDFYFYGDAATQDLADKIASDIAAHWNEPRGKVLVKKVFFKVEFVIRGFHRSDLQPEEIWFNTNPRNNYFRIEETSPVHVSFVDGIRSNTGYFKLDNLLNNSTTAAHEYGHTLGLEHPSGLDIRGQGQPGIMYPRGTICDPFFQYDPDAEPLMPGGTINPYTRKVLQKDIDHLRLHKLNWNGAGRSVLGDFSSIFHEKYQ
jgi:hypothetical protein